VSTTAQVPPLGRNCDVVMKGGITSGAVYPRAIHELSHHYNFKNIGGTSAGALAAAVTAAAEYRRQKTGDAGGFGLLQDLPEELGAKLPGSSQRRLLSLFQPEQSTRRLFNALVYSLNKSARYGKVIGTVIAFMCAYWPATLASVAGSLAIIALNVYRGSDELFFGVPEAVLFLLFAVPAMVGFWLYRDVTRHVVANDYGLCTGMTARGYVVDALTPWLHELIQKAAGRGLEDAPVTFGDLWDPQALGTHPHDNKKAPNAINLRMFTTNLTYGRPYIMPFEDKTARLFFRPEELERYVPASVMRWIARHSTPYAPTPGLKDEGLEPTTEKGAGLWEVPVPEKFPIVLAARMSLSFPILFSAIPLWAIDFEPRRNNRGFNRCLFSDGGMCSNFPIHLFDGLIPQWPTFGLDLEPGLKFWSDPVYLPQHYRQGYGERANRFDEGREQYPRWWGSGETPQYREQAPPSPVAGFFAAILNVMQNWNDTALCRMPGVRDRIVRVRLNAREGGLNLDMDKGLIEAIANRGRDAAQELIRRFAPPQGAGTASGWDEQRWIRLMVLLEMLDQKLPGVRAAALLENRNVRSYQDLIDRATRQAPPGWDEPLDESAAANLKRLLKCLVELSDTFSANRLVPAFDCIPQTELRVRPPL
jgi:predicted acylesterase/phospholipase RssA